MIAVKRPPQKPPKPLAHLRPPAEQEPALPTLTHLIRDIMSDRCLCGADSEIVRVLPLEWLVANPGDAAGERFCAQCVRRFHAMR